MKPTEEKNLNIDISVLPALAKSVSQWERGGMDLEEDLCLFDAEDPAHLSGNLLQTSSILDHGLNIR